MDINKRVCLEADFILEQINNEITVYHPSLTTSVYMNESGAVIWQLCDGTRTIGEIIDILSEVYPESSRQITNDVLSTISDLVDHDIARLRD